MHRLIYELLPLPSMHQRAEDGALCQLALVGSQHIVEIALTNLLRPFVAEALTSPANSKGKRQFEHASHLKRLNYWVPKVTGRIIQFDEEPFISLDRLRDRRNSTVHAESSLATVQMARSALFSAVRGTQALHRHFGQPFPYKQVLSKYPIPPEPWFSQVAFPRVS